MINTKFISSMRENPSFLTHNCTYLGLREAACHLLAVDHIDRHGCRCHAVPGVHRVDEPLIAPISHHFSSFFNTKLSFFNTKIIIFQHRNLHFLLKNLHFLIVKTVRRRRGFQSRGVLRPAKFVILKTKSLVFNSKVPRFSIQNS